MRRNRFTNEQFAEIWNACESKEEVEKRTGYSKATVYSKSSKARTAGLELKKLPQFPGGGRLLAGEEATPIVRDPEPDDDTGFLEPAPEQIMGHKEAPEYQTEEPHGDLLDRLTDYLADMKSKGLSVKVDISITNREEVDG